MAGKEYDPFKVREIPHFDSYISFDPDLYKGGKKLLVAAGESQFGYPPIVDTLLQQYVEVNIEDGRAIYQDLGHYEKEKKKGESLDDMADAKRGIRNGFNITDEPNIFFREGGSVMAAPDLLELLPQDGTGALFNIPPNFPYPSIFAKQRGIELAMPELPLTNSANENLIEIMKNPRKYFIPGMQYLVDLNNPNNPTGSVASIDVVRNFARFLYNKGHILYVDEAFGEYMPRENSSIPLAQEFDNVVVSRTFSKGWGLPRLREYYLVVSRIIAEQLKNIPHPFSLDSLQIYLGNKLLEDPKIMDEHSSMIRRETKKVKTIMLEELKKRNIEVLPGYNEDELYLENPLITVRGGYYGFYYDLARYGGVKAASGEGFSITHPEISDKDVRIITPRRKSDGVTLVRRIEAVINRHNEGRKGEIGLMDRLSFGKLNPRIDDDGQPITFMGVDE